jgi:hypothetical protein
MKRPDAHDNAAESPRLKETSHHHESTVSAPVKKRFGFLLLYYHGRSFTDAIEP